MFQTQFSATSLMTQQKSSTKRIFCKIPICPFYQTAREFHAKLFHRTVNKCERFFLLFFLEMDIDQKKVTRNSMLAFWQCCVKWNVPYYALDKHIALAFLSGLHIFMPFVPIVTHPRKKNSNVMCIWIHSTNDLFIGFSRIVVLFHWVNPFFVQFCTFLRKKSVSVHIWWTFFCVWTHLFN